MKNKKSSEAPYSKLAILAFVLSLPFIILVASIIYSIDDYMHMDSPDPFVDKEILITSSLISSAASIILGIISLFHIKKHQLKGKWLAIVAIILPFILLFSIIGAFLF